MTIEEIRARKAQITVEMETEGADLDALEKEVRSLNEQEEALRQAAQEAAEHRRRIAEGLGGVKESHEAESEQHSVEEIRKSAAYADAYASFIKTGDAKECRTLLTENVDGGTIPLPVFLQEKIETAWEKDQILSRVSKSYRKGNLKVPFELSADGAYVHVEGSTAPTEQAITLGIVTITPYTVKKWISFSDEVEDMKGETFLNYIFDEIIYHITQKLSWDVLHDITTANASNGSTAVGVPQVTMEPSLITIPTATANLHESAQNIVVVMNRLTEVEFLAAHVAGNFGVDPFAGIPRVYSSHLPAYSTASGGDVYAIVGDLSAVLVNYPNGDGVTVKWDNLTKKKEDLIEVLGRQYAGHGITKLGRLVNLKKPVAATT